MSQFSQFCFCPIALTWTMQGNAFVFCLLTSWSDALWLPILFRDVFLTFRISHSCPGTDEAILKDFDKSSWYLTTTKHNISNPDLPAPFSCYSFHSLTRLLAHPLARLQLAHSLTPSPTPSLPLSLAPMFCHLLTPSLPHLLSFLLARSHPRLLVFSFPHPLAPSLHCSPFLPPSHPHSLWPWTTFGSGPPSLFSPF